MRGFGEEDFAHAVELGSLLGYPATVLANDENVDVAAEGTRGGERLGGRRRQALIVVLCQQKDCHL